MDSFEKLDRAIALQPTLENVAALTSAARR